jgi:hypothetical protein
MGRVCRGKAAMAPIQFSPTARQITPAAAVRQVQLPRPSKYRYPIEPEVFANLKGGARHSHIPRRELATLSNDRALVSVSGLRAAAPGAPVVATKPNISSQFSGIDATGWIPYDCAVAAGAQHVVCSVNSSIAAFDKAGNSVFQTTLPAWFADLLTDANIFDPRLIYDSTAQKFILATTAYNNSKQSWFLLSVSQTPDPNDRWWHYILDATLDGDVNTNNWADYPALGQDDNAVYLTANMFQWGQSGTFQYAKLRIIPKSILYAGGVLTFHDIVSLQNEDDSMVFTLHPCNSLEASPTEFLVNTIYPNGDTATQSKISLWSVQNPDNPSVQRSTIACDPYGIPPHADQKGGAPPLDTGDVRILNAVYRHGSVWAAFVTQHNWGDPTNVTAVYWLEIDSATSALAQQGIFGAPNFHYFYPAVMPDMSGNLIVVFGRSGSADYAGLCCAGRRNGDVAGSLGGSVLLKPGTDTYDGQDNSGRNRWGDYSAVSPEPAPDDADSVWMYGGYVNGLNRWSTWVAKAGI